MSIRRTLLCGGAIGFLLSVAVGAVAGNDLPLVNAAKNQDKAVVRALLKERVDVNQPEPDGTTALAWAAHWDDLELADLLIGADAHVNAANDYGVAPLSLACSNGSAAMVAKLLKAGANPNIALRTGQTPLMTCARTGSLEAVGSLLAREANVNAQETRQGQTALMWAVAAGHPDVARALIEAGADVHTKTHAPAGFTPALYSEAGYGINVTSKGGFTALMFAAQQGNVDSARILLDAGADVNERNPDHGNALVIAAASGHEVLALFLLENGADPNAADVYGVTALHYSVQRGLAEIRFFETDELYRPPSRNMPDLPRALLAHGANPNAQIEHSLLIYHAQPPGSANMVGATPFFLAAIVGDIRLMRLLAVGGADPHLPARGDYTPLIAAAGGSRLANRLNELDRAEEQRKALEAVKLLIELGADVNAANASGQTAMHAAAFGGADAIVELLAEKGAQVDVKERNGSTPWSLSQGITTGYAGEYGHHPSTSSLLVKLGAIPWTAQEVEAFLGSGFGRKRKEPRSR